MYEDLFHVINSGALGTYHLTSARTVTLNEIAKKFSTNPNWGNYRYFTPEIKCDLCLEKIYDLKEIDPIERLSSFITKHNFLISYKQ
jgi:hypothetical protein